MSTPSWSHDGKWLYFESSTADKSDSRIYRCPSTGGDAVAITTESGSFPFETYDGETVYFADGTNHLASLRPAAGTSALGGLPAVDDHSCWTVVRGGIYFVPAAAPKSLQYFDFTTRRVRQVFATAQTILSTACRSLRTAAGSSTHNWMPSVPTSCSSTISAELRYGHLKN